MKIMKVLRFVVPVRLRNFIWKIIPKIDLVNTYILKRQDPILDLFPINVKFIIRKIEKTDLEKLQKAYSYRGQDSFKRKVPPRMSSPEWTGLAVIDRDTGDIAYVAWVITKSIRYIEEFGILLRDGQFFLKDGFCVPTYRHQGLHTRMEQERINYSVQNGGKEIFIQISDANHKGKESVKKNGYMLYNQNRVLSWPIFNIYREMFSFMKNPFKKVVK